MDKNFINIDDLVRQRLGGGEEQERPGAWLQMRDLLDSEMPQKKIGILYWRRLFSAVVALLLVATISIGGYQMSSSMRNTNESSNGILAAAANKSTSAPVRSSKLYASINKMAPGSAAEMNNVPARESNNNSAANSDNSNNEPFSQNHAGNPGSGIVAGKSSVSDNSSARNKRSNNSGTNSETSDERNTGKTGVNVVASNSSIGSKSTTSQRSSITTAEQKKAIARNNDAKQKQQLLKLLAKNGIDINKGNDKAATGSDNNNALAANSSSTDGNNEISNINNNTPGNKHAKANRNRNASATTGNKGVSLANGSNNNSRHNTETTAGAPSAAQENGIAGNTAAKNKNTRSGVASVSGNRNTHHSSSQQGKLTKANDPSGANENAIAGNIGTQGKNTHSGLASTSNKHNVHHSGKSQPATNSKNDLAVLASGNNPLHGSTGKNINGSANDKSGIAATTSGKNHKKHVAGSSSSLVTNTPSTNAKNVNASLAIASTAKKNVLHSTSGKQTTSGKHVYASASGTKANRNTSGMHKTAPLGQPTMVAATNHTNVAPTTANTRNTKDIEKMVLVEHYIKTTQNEGYYKLDTISVETITRDLGLAINNSIAAIVGDKTTGTAGNSAPSNLTGNKAGTAGDELDDNEGSTSGRNSSRHGKRNPKGGSLDNATASASGSVGSPAIASAAPSSSARKSSSGKQSGTVDPNSVAGGANNSTAKPGSESAEDETASAVTSPALAATTTSASGNSGTVVKPTVAAKKGGTTTTAEKLSETFNDIKYKVAGVQFSPGLIAGINGTFFGPASFKGFQFGITGNFAFDDNWSVMGELKYFHRVNGNFAISDNYYNYTAVSAGQYKKELVQNSYGFSSIQSIELPISLRYKQGKFTFMAGGNIVYSFAISTGAEAIPVVSPTPVIVSAPGNDDKPKLNESDFTSRFGLGYLLGLSYDISPNMTLDFRSVQTVWDNSGSAGSKYISKEVYKNPSFQISVGYRFGGKKGTRE